MAILKQKGGFKTTRENLKNMAEVKQHGGFKQMTEYKQIGGFYTSRLATFILYGRFTY